MPQAPSSVRLALDANFPQDLLLRISPYILEAELVPIQSFGPGAGALKDWQVVVALKHRRFHAMVSNDAKMLYEPKVLTAVRRTNVSLIIIDGLGHDAIRATGALLLEIPAIARKLSPSKGKVFHIVRRSAEPIDPMEYLRRRAERKQLNVKDLMHEERITKDDLQDPLHVATLFDGR